MGILGLQERVRSRLFLRRDRYGRFFSALVYIPRDRFNTDVRQRIEAMLMRALQGERVDTNVQIGESPLAQLHMIVRPKPGASRATSTPPRWKPSWPRIVRNWHDELRDHLVAAHGEEAGPARWPTRYGRALPAGYVEASRPSSRRHRRRAASPR